MAKKNLTIDQKIKAYKRKKRITTIIKISLATIALAMLVPIVYYGYYYVVFSVMPAHSYDPDKNIGSGFSRPLHMMRKSSATYLLAYYYDDCWYVVDDTKTLMENRDNFTIYKKDDEWHEGTHLQLMIYENSYLLNNVPLSSFTLIDDRCFRNCKKKMTMEEFKDYLSEKGYDTVYIK